jgi:hypothetical protein
MPEGYFSLVHLLILLFVFLIIVGILLLLFLRLATWLNKRFPSRPGQRVSIAGVVTGGITDVLASGFLGVPVIIYIQAKGGSAAITSALNSGGWLYWLQMAIGVGCSALGGYIAAWIAQHDESLNGLLSSFLCTAIGLYSIVLGKGAQSLAVQILLLAAAPAFGFLGGYLRQIQKRTTGTPGIAGPVG